VTPEQRRLRASIAAHVQWSKTGDRSARTQPARDKFMHRFEVEVDPEGQLDPEDRARRAESARRAYFARLALASSRARTRKRGGAGE
jgi:hypothetical protein